MGVSPELLQMAQESEEERQQREYYEDKKTEAEMFAQKGWGNQMDTPDVEEPKAEQAKKPW